MFLAYESHKDTISGNRPNSFQSLLLAGRDGKPQNKKIKIWIRYHYRYVSTYMHMWHTHTYIYIFVCVASDSILFLYYENFYRHPVTTISRYTHPSNWFMNYYSCRRFHYFCPMLFCLLENSIFTVRYTCSIYRYKI